MHVRRTRHGLCPRPSLGGARALHDRSPQLALPVPRVAGGRKRDSKGDRGGPRARHSCGTPKASPRQAPLPSAHGGVLGYGQRSGVVSDGVGKDRRWGRFAKATSGLRRLVILGHTGTISLEALRWLTDADASFIQIDADGRVIIASGSVHLNDARLRRAQAIAATNGVGFQIARELASDKLINQAAVLRELTGSVQSGTLVQPVGQSLQDVQNVDRLRILEAEAASTYWQAWKSVPVRFGRRHEVQTPSHWRTFGVRTSPFTGSPASPPTRLTRS